MIGEGVALEISTCTNINIKAIFFRTVEIEYYSKKLSRTFDCFIKKQSWGIDYIND